MKTAIILGATGLTGPHLLELLLEDSVKETIIYLLIRFDSYK